MRVLTVLAVILSLPAVGRSQAYVADYVAIASDDRQHPFLSLPWVVQSFPVQ